MMNIRLFSKFSREKQTWLEEHTIKFDESVRMSSKKMLNEQIHDGIDLYMSFASCSDDVKIFGYGFYQHCFIVAVNENANEESQMEHYIEFGSAKLDYDKARVNVNNLSREWKKEKSQHFIMNNSIRQRIEHVLGMTNYSLCLRNCEHVANYICRGYWYSNQLESYVNDFLLNTFMGDKKLLINTFPSKIRPNVFLDNDDDQDDNNEKKIYSFISDKIVPLFKPLSMQYFLDHDEIKKDNTYNVLFIGPTGCGKSHLINCLFNRRILESESSFNSVTNEIVMIKSIGKVYDNEEEKFIEKEIIITDTVGLSDNEWTGKNMPNLMEFLKARISSNFRHFDLVYIVFPSDRLLRHTRDTIRHILDWLDYANHVNRFRFIATKTDDLRDEDKRALKREAIEILDIKPNNSKLEPRDDYLFYFTGFPPERIDDEDYLTETKKNKIKSDLTLLYKNMTHTDNSARIEVNLDDDIKQYGRICIIL